MVNRRPRLRRIARSWLLHSLPAVLVSIGALGCDDDPATRHVLDGEGGEGGEGGAAGSVGGAAGAPDGPAGATGGQAPIGPCRDMPEGTACSDGNACNGEEICDGSGTCLPGQPVVCDATDACHEAGECNPDTGECSYASRPDGTACDDDDSCTVGDSCQDGDCVPGPVQPDGTMCDDGSACTGADICQFGECVGGNPVVCVAQDECHAAGVCDPETGVCSNPEKPNAVCVALPPDPSTVAPPIDPTVATNLGDATEFLYTGANPIQLGVASGTIDRRRAAVIRGRVKTRDGSPLSGVTVTIDAHTEFGTTRSRADGYFDLAVNGGGFVTLAYKKDGYLPAQRQVKAPWLDFALVPDVSLVPLDPNVTTVDLTSAAMQVARGSWMIDQNGARRMTLLFKPGTRASMALADCTSQPLELLSVRATEYTVGLNGPSAMPAELPPTSGYTYAVELSADEALAAGAKTVSFSQPAVGYLENFRGFPVGTPVPFALYDAGKYAWVPSENGLVIAVMDSGSAAADIDSNGDDLPDDEATLLALGFDDEERRFLRTTYAPSTTLWRFGIPHFTPGDPNFPLVGGPGATNPGQPPPQNPTPPDKPGCDDGCVIELESQIVGESVAVTGTPFTLEYRSDRVPGRKTVLRIPVTGSTLPPELLGASVQVSAAGKVELVTLPPLPNQSYDLVWDGLDAYGRPVQGDVPVTVQIAYEYQGYYSFTNRFGLPGSTPLVPAPIPYRLSQTHSFDGNYLPRLHKWDARGLGLGAWSLNVHHSYDPQAKVLRLGDGTRRTVESLQPEVATGAGTGAHGFAGDGVAAKDAQLDLSAPLFCDDYFGCSGGGGPSSGIAVDRAGGYYFADVGNCRLRYVGVDGTIQTVAGSGSCDVGYGEPAPAPEACGNPSDPLALSVDLTPIEVTVAPDGSVYIVSSPLSGFSGGGYGGAVLPDYTQLASKIYRLDPESGTLRRVAGKGVAGLTDEDIPAIEAHLRARDVAVARDGTLYIADTGLQRIRQVTPDGLITTIAGDGVRGLAGDVGPAKVAKFADPTGLALDADGALYVADQGNGRIRRIRADGNIETIAGGGSDASDHAAIADVRVSTPIDVAIGPDSTIHYAEIVSFLGAEGFPSGRIRKITPDGVVETVAGVSQAEVYEKYGRPVVERQTATSLHVMPLDVDVGPDGAVLFDDFANNRVFKVAPPLPGVGVTDSLIPSEDAGEVFVFDRTGRHLRTVNPRTGQPLLIFAYGATTRTLAAVTDADGNTTSIQRDSQGAPQSITGPYGQVTELGLDENGYLSLVRNPAGESASMTYTPDGLLSTFTDPRDGLHQFAWNSTGHLVGETNPTGVSKSFDRQDTNSYEVTKTSALGRQSSTYVDGPPLGPNTTVTTHPDLTQTIVVKQKDGSTITTTPDGTRRTVKRLPDERFGTLSPVTETIVETPSGLTSVASSSRQVVLADRRDPLSVASIVEQTVLNGNTFKSVYDTAALSYTRTSPEGRVTVETVDEQGRVVRRDTPGLASTFFSYNAQGLLAAVTRGTPQQTASDGGPRTTTFAYNALGQLDTVTAPLNQITRFLDYDGAGRALKQILPGNRTVSYTYDGNSNVTSVTPPGRPTHTLNYTPLDLMSEYAPPKPNVDGGGLWSTQYEYDADKSLDLVTRPDALEIDYRYDAAGRLNSIVSPSPTDPNTSESRTLGYDAAGRLETLSSPSGVSLTYGYDGPLVVSETWSGAVNGSISRAYDNQFRVVSETVAGTPAIGYGYSADGLLAQAGELSLDRDPETGFLRGTSLGSLSDAFTYNAFGEVASYTALAPDASILFGVVYDRDALGRIKTKTETIAGVTTAHGYSYDAAGRLEVVTKDGVETARYTYDANGNRLSKIVPGQPPIVATYDDQDRLIAYGGVSYGYGASGELVSKTDSAGTTSYAYDLLGNLRRVVAPDGTVTDYLVDGRNRRVGKKVDGVLVQAFTYASTLKPILELDGSGNVVSRFVHGRTKANVPDYLARDGKSYRLITDNLGSPRLVIDSSSGQIVQRIDYDEWGEVVLDTTPGIQPFGFAGGIFDPQTRFVRFGKRDYDPTSARWISKDPIGFHGGSANIYAYVDSSPVDRTDIGGMDAGAGGLGPFQDKGFLELFFDELGGGPPCDPLDPKCWGDNWRKSQEEMKEFWEQLDRMCDTKKDKVDKALPDMKKKVLRDIDPRLLEVFLRSQ